MVRLSDFLHDLQLSRRAEAFIVEAISNGTIASSAEEDNVNEELELIPPTQFNNDLVPVLRTF